MANSKKNNKKKKTSKKKSSAKKKSQTKNSSKPKVEAVEHVTAPINTSQSTTQWIQAIVLIFAVFAIAYLVLSDTSSDERQPTTTVIDESQSQTLQVREAVGDPEPLSQNLQSPNGQTSQEAAGQLQVPRGADSLQPNAKTLEVPL